jgi:hypothetical protein
MSIRLIATTLVALLWLTVPMVYGGFSMDRLQAGMTAQGGEAERTRLKQEANDLAVNTVALYKEAGHVILPVFKTIE